MSMCVPHGNMIETFHNEIILNGLRELSNQMYLWSYHICVCEREKITLGNAEKMKERTIALQ